MGVAAKRPVEEREDATGEEAGLHGLLGHIAAVVYETFEFLALVALATAVVMSVYEFFHLLVSEGFKYTDALEKILLILVFIDLMRTVVGGLVEGRFRMDILLEAITIAVARDMIGALALIKTEFNPLKLVVLTGMLAVSTLLWWLARRVERREPGPRLTRRRRQHGTAIG